MPESACWKGAPFWHELNDRNCRFEKLQALLSRRNIFDSNANPGLNVVQPGDVIPVPYIPMDELSLHVPPEDTPADSETNSCRPAKTTVELLSLEACSTPPPSSPQTPLDRRIAELEATIALDGASRLAASPRTIANLRPEPQLQTSSLIKETGITRLPNEITKRIVNSVEHRRDISALSCVSKRWRVDTMSALYSILILRGWDEVILCLRTVYSVKDIANYINDLTIDVAHLPESLNEMFYATLENALDKTRNLRRLAIIMDNNRKIAPHLERALGQCRFRLHHFVYEGPSYPGHLSEFLDLQTSIRTLQIPYMDTPSSLPPYVTQLWVSFPLRNAASFQILSENLKCLSHFSFRGELSWAASRLRDHNIHYLAYDIAPWISSASSLPPTFRFHISGFSRLRILRLIGYWVICETVADATIVPQPENAAQPNQFGFPGLPAAPQGMDGLYTFIGYLIDAQSNDSTEPITTSPALYIEPAFLDILSHLPNLQALEVGSFAVRDAGRLRTRPGHTKHWLAQRLRWEDEFVHRVTSQASQRLAVVSFLACDEQLYGSCFQELPPRYRWGRYLQKVKKQIAQDDAVSGTTLPELISQTGLARWSGSASEPDNKCDYRLNSAFVPSILSRQLLEEVVTSEWVKAGTGNTWTRRLNVRNLRDIWPPGC